MTDRRIISYDDFRYMLVAAFGYTKQDKYTFDDYVRTQLSVFEKNIVPANAKGFYVIDDNGDTKCVRFPE